MTKNENMKLARRAVACNGWRWMPGMLAVFSEYEGGCRCRIDGEKGAGNAEHAREAGALPLLTDPATLGCLLVLAQEAWKGCAPGAWITVALPGEQSSVEIEKLAEALVEALEAAP